MTGPLGYNGAPPPLSILRSGEPLWRITRTGSAEYPSAFKSDLPALVDASALPPEQRPPQGRFEPVPGSGLGGYLYAAEAVTGAVAEGLLREKAIPPSGVIPRLYFRHTELVELRLAADIDVVDLVQPSGLSQMSLNASVFAARWPDYGTTRELASVLLRKSGASGIRYPCRHHILSTALLLVDRAGSDYVERIAHHPLGEPNDGRDRVIASLRDDFGLRVAPTDW